MYSLQKLINNQNSQLIYYTIRSLSTLANSQGTLQKYTPGKPFELHVGDYIKWKRKWTQEMVDEFARLSCDSNPIHSSSSLFEIQGKKTPIVHGILLGSMFSAMIGSYLPGVIYMKQTLAFPNPTPVNTEVEATVTVKRIFQTKKIAIITTDIKTGDIILCNGEATVQLPFL